MGGGEADETEGVSCKWRTEVIWLELALEDMIPFTL